MTTTDLAWTMDDLDDVDEIDHSRVCRCNYEEDEKNQKILVGRLISSRDQCVNPYSSQQNAIALDAGGGF